MNSMRKYGRRDDLQYKYSSTHDLDQYRRSTAFPVPERLHRPPTVVLAEEWVMVNRTTITQVPANMEAD
jgi:hypothetical protein